MTGEVDWRSIAGIEWDRLQQVATEFTDMAAWNLQQLKDFILAFTTFVKGSVG